MASSFGATNVVVAVRARPLTPQEEDRGGSLGQLTLAMNYSERSTTLIDPATGAKKKFHFDYNYWSIGDSNEKNFASQNKIYEDVAAAQLKHALSGYNACIFAYGQTSSGKTYTMMGPPSPHSDHARFIASTGLTPRMCKALFDQINSEVSKAERISFRVEMSYYEIYNEKVYCLLDPATNDSLRPREDPKAGPYVENLSAIEVSHYLQVAELMRLGNKTRHTSRTKMNDRSSRSHAVFCLTITKSEFDKKTGDSTEWISRVNLVDLAGSERTNKAGTEGDTLKEGININKSLTSLGMVIKRLADINDPSVQTDGNYVPYRDSTLTWLLKDNLGGNSRTVMLATLSPCLINYEETLTTLRYAERVKLIKNVPSVNKRASNRRIIRDLRSQIRELNKQLQQGSSLYGSITAAAGQGEAAICHRGTPSALWASVAFLQTETAYNQPFIWFLKDGFTFVTSISSYAALAADDANYSPPKSPSNSTSGKQRKRSSTQDNSLERRASGFGVKRTPSFMQPTLAFGFKDIEVAEHLRGSKPNEWGRDLAHTLLKEEDHEKEQRKVQRVRSAEITTGKKTNRRRSTSASLGGRKDSARHKTPRRLVDSVSRALDAANTRINNAEAAELTAEEDILNIREGGYIQIEHEQSEGEDDEEPAAANASNTLAVQHPAKLRSSSVLGVSLSTFGKMRRSSTDRTTGSHPQSQSNTPREVGQGFEYQHLLSCWDDASAGKVAVPWPDPSTLPFENSSIHSVKLTGLSPQQDDGATQPYAVFQVAGERISLLPLGDVKLNGNLMNPSSGSVQLPSRCELQFGEHPSFVLNNPLASTGRKLSIEVEGNPFSWIQDPKSSNGVPTSGVAGSDVSRAIQRRASELVQATMNQTRDDIALQEASATSALHQQQQTIQLQREDTKRQDERIKLLENELTRMRKKQTELQGKLEQGKQLTFERQINGEWKMSSDANEDLKNELMLVRTSEAERLKRELLTERAEHEFTKRDMQHSAEQERTDTLRQLQQTQDRLRLLQTSNATIREQLSESTAKNEDRAEMTRKLADVTKSLSEVLFYLVK